MGTLPSSGVSGFLTAVSDCRYTQRVPGERELWPLEYAANLNILAYLSVKRDVMNTRRTFKRPQRTRRKNEWLDVIAALDKLLAKRASSDIPIADRLPINNESVNALNFAYAATLRYYTGLIEGRKHDVRLQRHISRLWQKAGTRMRKDAPRLASRLKANNRFWLSEVTWSQETIQKVWAHLNSIRTSTNILTPAANAPHRWSTFSTS